MQKGELDFDGVGFSWKNSYAAAALCQRTYGSPNSVQKLLKLHGYRSKWIESKDLEGFIADKENATVVCFRGALDFGGWAASIAVDAEAVHGLGRINSGFYKSYKSMHEKIKRAVGSRPRDLWLIGHNLGGAVATIAAMELAKEGHNVSGLFTFGQPATGDSQFVDTATTLLSSRYARFVNDRDLVSRLPPGLEHGGILTHLKPRYSYDLNESVDQSIDEKMLSPETFKALQAEVRRQVELSNQPMTKGAIARKVDVILPGMGDHIIGNYVQQIRNRMISSEESLATESLQFEKGYVSSVAPQGRSVGGLESSSIPDPASETASSTDGEILESAETPSNEGQKKSQAGYPFIIQTRNADWVAPSGVTVHSKIGTIATVSADSNGVEALKNDVNVISSQFSHGVDSQELTNSFQSTNTNQVHQAPINEKGDQCIVGIIDSLVDLRHQAFLNPDGSTRFLGVWIQYDPVGPTPKQVDPAFTQDYGTLYTQQAIDVLLASGGELPGWLGKSHEHGTHVSSIAAGNWQHAGTSYVGIAPESPLIHVVAAAEFEEDSPSSLGYSVSHVDALHFMRAAAAGVNAIVGAALPIAINVSQGQNAGAHDGTSLVEKAFDGITGGGRDPGIVIVKSAGNERDQAGHASADVAMALRKFEWRSKNVKRHEDRFELWYRAGIDLDFQLFDPSGQNHTPLINAQNPQVDVLLGNVTCRARLIRNHPDNSMAQLEIVLTGADQVVTPGTWKLTFIAKEILDSDRKIHIWVERNRARAVRFATGESEGVTLSIPGTALSVVTVAATQSDDPLVIAPFSSIGPTLDGRPKPDVCAPGFDVVAAMNNGPLHSEIVAMPGTSMAAPHVAGACALAMSLRRKKGLVQWGARQLCGSLQLTVRNRTPFHDHEIGYGFVDIKKFIDDAGV